MKKAEYIRMLIEDNATAAEPQKEMNAAIIDCVDIGRSEMHESGEGKDKGAGLAEFWVMIQIEGKASAAHGCSPHRAAELIAERLGAKYERASVRYATKPAVKRLEDFL